MRVAKDCFLSSVVIQHPRHVHIKVVHGYQLRLVVPRQARYTLPDILGLPSTQFLEPRPILTVHARYAPREHSEYIMTFRKNGLGGENGRA